MVGKNEACFALVCGQLLFVPFIRSSVRQRCGLAILDHGFLELSRAVCPL
jgi:hypothetical protein